MAKKLFNENLYQRVSLGNLIIFCLFSISEKRQKSTFGQIVNECFTLFPKSFSFVHFPKWPDARKLDRTLRSLRARKLISGSPETLFSLTKLGKKIAEETAKTFRQGKLL